MARQAKSFADLHNAGFGRWKLPTRRQINAIADYIIATEGKEALPAPNPKSYSLALHRIRLVDPAFLTV